MPFNYVIRYKPCVAHDTRQLLTRETLDFIPPSLWSYNRPDLNAVDCRVWVVLQKGVYRENIWILDELWQCITEEWERMDQRLSLIHI